MFSMEFLVNVRDGFNQKVIITIIPPHRFNDKQIYLYGRSIEKNEVKILFAAFVMSTAIV